MKKLILVVLLFLAPRAAAGQELVTMPWAEFKEIYRERLEKEFREKLEAGGGEWERRPVYTIDEAAYDLRVVGNHAEGNARLSGKIVSGPPRPIPLFGGEMILVAASEVVGGDLVCDPGGSGKTLFIPDAETKEFRLSLCFLAPIRDTNGASEISFEVPAALRNILKLELPRGSQPLEVPGIAGADGEYRFSPRPTLTVRFLGEEALAQELVEVDALSRIRVQGDRAVATTWFYPVQPLRRAFILRTPEGARYAGSSLPASAVAKGEDGAFEILPPPNQAGIFWMRFAFEKTEDDAEFTLSLPRIDNNGGSEGNFIIEEPPDGQVRLTGAGAAAKIPITRLGKELARAAGADRNFTHVPPNATIGLRLTRFQTVATPPVVLKSLWFFTAFEESGGSLSTLVMEIPPEAGPRLRLPLAPGAAVWSVIVNGERKKLYADADNAWIIPLAVGETSRVEIVMRRDGEPLGLRGRIETTVPATGLACQKVRIGLALPERVRLLSIEGPVSPDRDATWEKPIEFVGKAYYFTRSFHEGGEMKLAVSYKEPVEHNAQ